MNRNHMLKRKMTAGLAVGMAVAVGSVPMVMAANTANTKDSSSSVSKEETVYVNADASGNPQQITVSNWLKNAGSESSVEDQYAQHNEQNDNENRAPTLRHELQGFQPSGRSCGNLSS